MKQSEIKELAAEALVEQIATLKKQYADLKVAHAVTPLENPLQLKEVRRTISRLSTELTNRDNQ